jgi:hypothetical protein
MPSGSEETNSPSLSFVGLTVLVGVLRPLFEIDDEGNCQIGTAGPGDLGLGRAITKEIAWPMIGHFVHGGAAFICQNITSPPFGDKVWPT